MASWPGTSRSHSALASFAGDPWEDTRSEVYAARLSPMLQPAEDCPVWTSPVSTATDTLQPNSRWISDDSPPKTTSTVPLYGYPAEEVIESDPDLNARVQRIHETQPCLSSASSQQFHLPDNLPVHIQDNDVHLATILDKVAALQEDLFVQRSHARNFRSVLRHKREQENQIRRALQNNLNSIIPEEVDAKALRISQTIENLQAATASYLGLEAEYQMVEDALEQKEQDLDKHMAELTGILRKDVTLLAQEKHDIDVHSDSPVHHNVPAEDTHDFSPEAAEYISLVEDARVLRTRLEKLTRGETEYIKIVDQQKFRGQNGLPLDNNAQLFLEQYEDERNNIEGGLNETHLRLENHPGRKMPQDDIVVVTDDEWRDLLKEYLLDYTKDQPSPDPLRASKLDDRSPFFETGRPLPLNKSNFVNHWLLYRLRHSAIEVLKFKSQPELLDLMEKGWDGDSISQMAMRLWYEDGTTKVETA
ncbi:hypothetical protein N7509_010593 [Penicillium cosmopolitanum]|uniref:Uncharacterized protein n=1 Tax=Penicillium cosmopolitanum TaxID=1131564 RepID=A0A9W9VRM7_9EURO|nr:uncharacterized protein N7509_010593 [Penicillium cosmopolitanum]KAJ5388052.1 hypothetical protein N7509_010593 [Penicillium cosmopolitanum]